jgi:hypothetical protein
MQGKWGNQEHLLLALHPKKWLIKRSDSCICWFFLRHSVHLSCINFSRLIYPRECFWMDLVAGYLVTIWSYFPSFSAHRCTKGCTSKSSHSELVTQRIVHVVFPMLTLRKAQPRRYLLIEPEIPILISDHDWLQLTLFSFVRTILNLKP